MKRISFKDSGGLNLTQAVLSGRKTMTRRIAYKGEIKNLNTGFFTEGKDKGRLALCESNFVVTKSQYGKCEVVAIQQAYIAIDHSKMSTALRNELEHSAGFKNKIFVKAELMPHHIRITDVHVERLQDISDDDCLREGVAFSDKHYCKYGIIGLPFEYDEPREAFAGLIDKVSGRGTWDSNPLVWVYSFEMVD